MKCPFCSSYHELPIKKEDVTEHLIVTANKKFHFHIHGPIKEKSLMKLFLLRIAKEAKIDIEESRDRVEEIGGGVKNTGGRVEEKASSEEEAPSENEEKRSSEGCRIYEE